MSNLLRLAFLCLSLLASGWLMAADKALAGTNAESKRRVDEAATIRVQLEHGRDVEYVKPQERSAIESRLIRRERLWADAEAKDAGVFVNRCLRAVRSAGFNDAKAPVECVPARVESPLYAAKSIESKSLPAADALHAARSVQLHIVRKSSLTVSLHRY